MLGHRCPHMMTPDVGTLLSPPPPHLPPLLLLPSAGSNYPRGKKPTHPVQFLLKSVVLGGQGTLIKKITYRLELLGWSTVTDVRGRNGGGVGVVDDELMMAATSV